MMDLLITLIVVQVTQVYAYVRAHQMVCIKHVQVLYTDCTSIKILQDRGVYPPRRSSEAGPNPDKFWEPVLGGTSCHSGLPTSSWDPACPQGTCTSLNNVGKGNRTQRLSGVFWSFLAVGAERRWARLPGAGWWASAWLQGGRLGEEGPL